MKCHRTAARFVLLFFCAWPVYAQDAGGLLDEPYPGPLSLHVDLTDSARKILRVHEVIPVHGDTVSLLYPKWIPGEHAPSGTIEGVAGIKISAGGKTLAWRRDLIDMYLLHVQLPQDTGQIEMDFQFLSPTSGGEFGQSVSATDKLVDLEWNQVAFYPAGYYSRQIVIDPSVTIPAAWTPATALEIAAQSGGEIRFKPVTFNNLVDSPLIAGINFQRFDLAPGAKIPVHLDVVADRPANLAISDEQVKVHRELISQARALFGSQHYDHYDFLFTISDKVGHFGLEHHQSSDDRLGADFFTDPMLYLLGGELLPHEYVHSWNGKFRRPADLWTPNFNTPMQTDLLWVYEGLTEYLGYVLPARAGIWTPEEFREGLAEIADDQSHVVGRSWRPLQDTADEAQVLYYTPGNWRNWRRRTDFYSEGLLIWLDVDTEIRQRSNGRRSLDDFIKAFYGINDGSYVTVTYRFEDIVAALNAVQAMDWAGFLHARLEGLSDSPPMGGLEKGGWKLVYSDQESDFSKADEKVHKHINLMSSVGLSLNVGEDTLSDVLWNGPAFSAGLAPGMKLIAVNGEAFTSDILKDAIAAAASSAPPIELLVKNLDSYQTVKIDYHGGLRYPHLQRIDGTPDRIGAIGKAR